MKAVLQLFVAMTLLLQGGLAVAMPVQLLAAQHEEEMVMPCDEMADEAMTTMSCCKDMSGATCHAICSVAALPVTLSITARPSLAAPVEVLTRYSVLAAHRDTPLRPPILLSA